MFPDFVPIELRGMSILTALAFFFYTAGFGFFYTTLKRDFKRINTVLQKHEEKLEKTNGDIAEMKTNIALTLQTVTRMERILERRTED